MSVISDNTQLMKKRNYICPLLLAGLILVQGMIFICPSGAQQLAGNMDPVNIRIDLSETIGEMGCPWAMFGYDEPNYTYMRDGKKLLTEISDLSPVPVYIRTHNLFTSGDGTPSLKWGSTNAYTEDGEGNPVYDWTLTDRIFDTYLERGMKPLVEIGFMPEALSSRPSPYRHHWSPGASSEEIFTGWAFPPYDYEKWAKLVHEWVSHCVEKYGKSEVESWYWELWNEPNIGYWQGTQDEYLKLYDYTAEAVKSALPTARMGGPHTTGPSWDQAEKYLRSFIEHCLEGTNHATGKKGAPLDYIGFHAKGRPGLQDGVILMNMGTQLRDISKGFEVVSSYPALKDISVIIGESDPEGCAACSMNDYPENAYRNGTVYSSYTAASFPRVYELADHFGVNLRGIVTWAFEFEDQPWFNGYRDLATNGVDKPVLNIFRMFGMMQGQRVKVTGDLSYDFILVRDSSVRGAEPDISAMATVTDSVVALLVWNYHDLNKIRPAPAVNILIEEIPFRKALLEHYRVGYNHSNSYEVWKSMGSPRDPTELQYRELEKAGKLQLFAEPEVIPTDDGRMSIPVELGGQEVSLILLRMVL
jgi:xylan 1,4-beta-xylosidase